jgi:hypothetical protein
VHAEEGEEDEGHELKKSHKEDHLSEEQLKSALDYYRSSRTHTRELGAMKHNFRFIKGQHHIQQMLR